MVDKPPRKEHGQEAPQVASGIQEAAASADQILRQHNTGKGEEKEVEELKTEANAREQQDRPPQLGRTG